jgi:hypothetical protein
VKVGIYLMDLNTSVWNKLPAPTRRDASNNVISVQHPYVVRVLPNGGIVATYAAHQVGNASIYNSGTNGFYKPTSGVFHLAPGATNWSDRTKNEMRYFTRDLIATPEKPMASPGSLRYGTQTRSAISEISLFPPATSVRVTAIMGGSSEQRELSLTNVGSEQGYIQWLTARQLTAENLGRKMNLPLGHQVEVWLYGGIRIRGTLHLRDQFLFIDEQSVRHMELFVDHVSFSYREMESCVRLD